MDSTTTFPIRVDRPSRIPMTVLGTGPNVSRVKVSSSTVDIRMGWAFQATIPREAVASARPLNRGLSELDGPMGLSVLRGVNYWRGTALVNGAGTGLVEIMECPRFDGHLSAGSVGAWPEDVHRGWEQQGAAAVSVAVQA